MLVTDSGAPEIRATEDVDLVCRALALPDYYRLESRLREKGFTQDVRPGAPICRWRIGEIAIDVMPMAKEILGFSNRWYPLAMTSAVPVALPSGRMIRQVAAPVFLATKLEAFHGRGRRDFMLSHDLEDVIAVVDGRAGLLDECRTSPPELRRYLAEQFSGLLATAAFVDALPGFLQPDAANQGRLAGLRSKLRQLASVEGHAGR